MKMKSPAWLSAGNMARIFSTGNEAEPPCAFEIWCWFTDVSLRSSMSFEVGSARAGLSLAALFEVADQPHQRPQEGEIDDCGADQRRWIGHQRLRVGRLLQKVGHRHHRG